MTVTGSGATLGYMGFIRVLRWSKSARQRCRVYVCAGRGVRGLLSWPEREEELRGYLQYFRLDRGKF